jgi:uncharacterized membrane-anchored protein YitT (DUF2179 family)
MKLFLFPYNIPSGGAAGISVLLHHLLHIPNGTGLFVLNALLLLLGLRLYGLSFAAKTMFTVFLMSVTVDLLPFQPPVSDRWIAATLGAIGFGTSMSIILYSGSTTGGMDILAKWLEQQWGSPFGSNLFVINSLILLTTGALLGWQITLLGVYVQLLATGVVNLTRNIRSTAWQSPQQKEAPLQ